ncbi:ATP synthase F1, delta subunit [Ehrlichia chaffeensis str. Heartland]|uniref:ATP synthase F1 subunit delta n=1 Tax=Ehrlichia chaffeensis TaxID=945 RepID=UPI000053AE65|nr:ATP synthase F1 subunit delta [Ehrlichia chaffeensis]AHX04073.1 ATP synthase F1, delta subunit [Ehrlichia chaffeensis str. Heartland]AHX06996.1 ATP synthase F1, delta subunit [Ehrlichia chaffeensis str. Liberty]AHX08844.1 ATP synthase F1, delta subunit [Ehrlichia chaffeensis str. Saint Vincent]AHX10593.1 ATP synthase F1, delta subunit [Ehrlichia chaffeensis str. West Paces]
MIQYRGGYIASCYAQALFSVSSNVNSICKNAEFVVSVLENCNDISLFLSNPRVSREDKVKLIEVIGDYIDSILVKFIMVVIENNRGNILLQILNTFLDLVKKHNREVSISVTSCAVLTKQEEEGICDALFEKYGKVVSITNNIDPSILGGFIIRVNFDVIDVSLNSYLQSLRELSKMAIRSSISE